MDSEMEDMELADESVAESPEVVESIARLSSDSDFDGELSKDADDDDEDVPDSKTINTHIRCVRDSVHSALLRILKGKDIPKKKRTLDEIAAYRIKQKPLLSVITGVVKNPLSGKEEERVLVRPRQCRPSDMQTILLKDGEVEACVKFYHNRYKGSGVRKLHKAIMKRFSGVSVRQIAAVVNSMHRAQRLKPTFLNKAPLKPVQSSAVMNQVQIDLVDMRSSKVTVGSDTFSYILVVLDVFSRFIFLRALRMKSSAEVARHLLSIFADSGPPRRLQSDQGSEFKGAVKQLMDTMQVEIIHSRPYYPQSQGKIERSHRTWKSFLMYDVMGGFNDFMNNQLKQSFDWVTALPMYQHLYNTTVHSALGCTPFEVFYGRTSNSELYLMSHSESDSPDHDDGMDEGSTSDSGDKCDDGASTLYSSDDITRHLELIKEVRATAKNKSNKADKKMVEASKAKTSVSEYKCGDKVIVRRFSSSSRRKSKQRRFVAGEIIQHSSNSSNYKVKYVLDGKLHEEWFKVTDLTSLTREEEKCRHQAAGNDKKGTDTSASEGVTIDPTHDQDQTAVVDGIITIPDSDSECPSPISTSDQCNRVLTLLNYSLTENSINHIVNTECLSDEAIDYCLLCLKGLHSSAEVCVITAFIKRKLMKTKWDYTVMKKFFTSTGQMLKNSTICILPVHVPGHWKLGVVNMKKMNCFVLDPLSGANSISKPTTMIKELVKTLTFILHNGKNPASTDCADNHLSILNIQGLPCQKNSTDCGVVICKYAEQLFQGMTEHMSFDTTPTSLRHWMLSTLLSPSTITSLQCTGLKVNNPRCLYTTQVTHLLQQHGCNRRRSDVINTLSQSQGQSVEKSQLQRNMEKAGLILRRNVPTDGNCLFHAVSDQLKRLKLQRYRHRQLRQMCIDQIRSNPIIDDGTPTGCHLSKFVDTGEEWDSYLTRMSEDWEWGSHIELVALADALGVPILITTGSSDDNFQVWLYPSVLHTDKVMLLGHSINHYYSLEVDESAESATKVSGKGLESVNVIVQDSHHECDKVDGRGDPAPDSDQCELAREETDNMQQSNSEATIPDLASELDISICSGIEEKIILSLDGTNLYGRGIMDIIQYSDLDRQTLTFLLKLSLAKYRRGTIARLKTPHIKLCNSWIGMRASDADCNYCTTEIKASSENDITVFVFHTSLQWQLLLAYKSEARLTVFTPLKDDPEANLVSSKLLNVLNKDNTDPNVKPTTWKERPPYAMGDESFNYGYQDSGILVYKYFECIVRRRQPILKISLKTLREHMTRLLLTSYELPEVQDHPDLQTILYNGDIGEPESEDESDVDENEKSLFELIPDFSFKPTTSKPDGLDDDVVTKFGSVEQDWIKDSKVLAWRKSDISDDKNSIFKRDWIRQSIKSSEKKWISLLTDAKAQSGSYYHKKFISAKFSAAKPKRKAYDIQDWPLKNGLPDMIEEVKHYMLGLCHLHLPNKGVVWRVNMAYDVLFNEAMVHLLMSKYSIGYTTAVDCHLKETIPGMT